MNVRRQLYRINLFHTTCTVEVNGYKRYYFNDKLYKILQILVLQNRGDFKEMNNYLKAQCEKIKSQLTTVSAEITNKNKHTQLSITNNDNEKTLN